MTNLLTLVQPTAQVFTTGQSARDVHQVTRDVSPQLVFPHTPLLCQLGARRALWVAVTRVPHWTQNIQGNIMLYVRVEILQFMSCFAH